MKIKLKEPVDGMQEVEVQDVPEIVDGSCRGCCFLSYPGDFHVVGVYRTTKSRCNAMNNAKFATPCEDRRVIFVANTDEGRAAYITTKLLSS